MRPPETPFTLTTEQRDQILSLLDQGVSQRRVIAQVFHIKPGGSSKYQAARAAIRALTPPTHQEN